MRNRKSASSNRILLATMLFLAASVEALEAAPSVTKESRPVVPNVETLEAEAIGNTGVVANGRIESHGLPTKFYFEYGVTTNYEHSTTLQALPPRSNAFYHESWDDGAGGWTGGLLPTEQLGHFRNGGACRGFVRFSEPSGNDFNHLDGIGMLHLCKHFYPGHMAADFEAPAALLGGGDPDLRGARISLFVRGNRWKPNGSELVWWSQTQSNPEQKKQVGWRRANWAYTGHSLNDALASGNWEKVDYKLENESFQWSYAGNNLAQDMSERYEYWPLNHAQQELNANIFHLLAFVDPQQPPEGSIDFDEFVLTYPNYSLLTPSNGGRLRSQPHGRMGNDGSGLTDGWRNGNGQVWTSSANPSVPLEFVFELNSDDDSGQPVVIRTIQLHQNPDWPAKVVEVLVSQDAKKYIRGLKRTLPRCGSPNANYAFTIDTGLALTARYLKVRILSGYRQEHWGLGEIEVFGSGAPLGTDDEPYFVTTDIAQLRPGTTYNYRVVAKSALGTKFGENRTFRTPDDRKPLVTTGAASRVGTTSARLAGRLNPLGQKTQFYFEYGTSDRYGSKSSAGYGGLQITPRAVFAVLDELEPGATYHYRLVASNESGMRYGKDAVFTTAVPDR